MTYLSTYPHSYKHLCSATIRRFIDFFIHKKIFFTHSINKTSSHFLFFESRSFLRKNLLFSTDLFFSSPLILFLEFYRSLKLFYLIHSSPKCLPADKNLSTFYKILIQTPSLIIRSSFDFLSAGFAFYLLIRDFCSKYATLIHTLIAPYF